MSNYIMLTAMHPRSGDVFAVPSRSASADSGVLRYL